MSSAKKANAARIGTTTAVLELDRPLADEIEAQDASGAAAASKMMSGGLDPREMAHKRWGVDWHNIPVPEGNVLLGDLKEEFERAAKIMQQRQVALSEVECACGICGRRFLPALACMSRTLRDEKTLLPYNIYFATQECVRQQNKKQYGMVEMIK